tara:strand:- start:486 stop:671 length:186 start_codon:yes stop_codon:yes gene_type:complete
MKEIDLIDDCGRRYRIKKFKKFKNHILKYHTANGKPDNSLHIENGRSFTITNKFFDKLMKI